MRLGLKMERIEMWAMEIWEDIKNIWDFDDKFKNLFMRSRKCRELIGTVSVISSEPPCKESNKFINIGI